MVSEDRFNRLEDKVDRTADIVVELKHEVHHMNEKFEQHIELVEEHILGDNKIVDQLVDIIPDLSSMVSDYKLRSEIKREKQAAWDRKVKLAVDITKFIGVPSAVIGLGIAVLNFMGKL